MNEHLFTWLFNSLNISRTSKSYLKWAVDKCLVQVDDNAFFVNILCKSMLIPII